MKSALVGSRAFASVPLLMLLALVVSVVADAARPRVVLSDAALASVNNDRLNTVVVNAAIAANPALYAWTDTQQPRRSTY